jgi:Cys-tRNA(Pro) deacylase
MGVLHAAKVPAVRCETGAVTDTPALRDPRLGTFTHEVVRHGRVSSLEEAAERRGVEPSAVIKTMVVRRGEGDHVLVLVPGDRVIDWAKLRAFVGERRLSMPDADEALEVTGYARGTITPFGSPTNLPVIADERITGTISIGGGDHGVSVTADAGDVLDAIGARTADVTKPAR